MHIFFEVYKKTFDYYGRSRRKEFWTFTMVNGAMAFLITFIYYFYSDGFESHVFEVVNSIIGIFVLFPFISLVIRRLHDTGRSGWWGLYILVPLIGQLMLLIFMLQDSQLGYNEYGEYSKFNIVS